MSPILSHIVFPQRIHYLLLYILFVYLIFKLSISTHWNVTFIRMVIYACFLYQYIPSISERLLARNRYIKLTKPLIDKNQFIFHKNFTLSFPHLIWELFIHSLAITQYCWYQIHAQNWTPNLSCEITPFTSSQSEWNSSYSSSCLDQKILGHFWPVFSSCILSKSKCFWLYLQNISGI